MHSDGEVQALFPTADEEPQTKSAGKRIQDECHHWEPALHGCKPKNFITEDLIKWPTALHKAVHSSQPQTQKAVVDTLHQHYLTHNEDWVPDVAAEVAGHLSLKLRKQTQMMLTIGPECPQMVHSVQLMDQDHN